MHSSLLNRLSCLISGHDYTIRQSGGRMFLYCTACEHRSDGIALNGRSDGARHEPRRRGVSSLEHSSPGMRQNHVVGQ